MDYICKNAICPYFERAVNGTKVYCECAKLNFRNARQAKQYFACFCASYDYEKCTIARSLTRFYEEAESMEVKNFEVKR